MPVLTAYFPMLAKGILGKGGLFVAQPLEDCLIGLTGSSTRAETGCTDLQIIGSRVRLQGIDLNEGTVFQITILFNRHILDQFMLSTKSCTSNILLYNVINYNVTVLYL